MEALAGLARVEYSLGNDSQMAEWDRFVESHPDGTPFHTSAWMRAVRQAYPFKPVLPVFKDDSGRIAGVFPAFIIKSYLFGNHLVSLPFSDVCFPLFAAGCDGAEALRLFLDEMKRKVKYVEIRGPVPDGARFACHDYYKEHVIPLSPDPAEVERKVNKKTILHSIKKARKEGVLIRQDDTLEGVKEFYRLNLLTRKKHGVPPQPIEFFAGLHQHMIAAGRAFLLLAEADGTVIAGGVFMGLNGRLVYKYNASDPAYLTRKTPNHLLTWHAIERACREGYIEFDFGRTAPDNEGLMRYKEMWGAEARSLPYYFHPKVHGAASHEGSGVMYRILTELWRSMPDAVTARLGPVIFRHLA